MLDSYRVPPHLSKMTKTTEIYTKFGCPYCSRAKQLLSAKDVKFEEYDITMGGPKREEMIARSSGASTVPQIFIGNKHIGGSDDLYALEQSGKLDPLLAQLAPG